MYFYTGLNAIKVENEWDSYESRDICLESKFKDESKNKKCFSAVTSAKDVICEASESPHTVWSSCVNIDTNPLPTTLETKKIPNEKDIVKMLQEANEGIRLIHEELSQVRHKAET